MLDAVILIQRFYKKRYFNKICLPVLLDLYNKKIDREEFYSLSQKLKIFGNQCLNCTSWYSTHTVLICLNCKKKYCFDCPRYFRYCCFTSYLHFVKQQDCVRNTIRTYGMLLKFKNGTERGILIRLFCLHYGKCMKSR
jgi:hypothetical protein